MNYWYTVLSGHAGAVPVREEIEKHTQITKIICKYNILLIN